MNLFCFSLEGSMDSLYEAVQESCDAQVYTIPCRSCSPAVPLDDNNKWRSTGRCISMDISHINTDNTKKAKRSSLQKSISETEALDCRVCTNSLWQATRKQEDLVLLRNNQNEDLRPLRKAEYSQAQTGSRNTPQDLSVQTETASREMMPLNGTRFKKVDRKLNQRGTPTLDTAGAKGMVPLLLDVGAQVHTQENSVGSRVMETASSRKRWSNPTETPLTWVQAHPSGQSVEYRIHNSNRTTSKSPSQGHQLSVQTIKRDPSPKGVVRSTTNVDFCAYNVSLLYSLQFKTGYVLYTHAFLRKKREHFSNIYG